MRFKGMYRIELNNSLDFVKIISLKNGNFGFALRKRLFCNAKPTLLPCKTAAFGMQNNRFCKALIYRLLRNSYACKKYLHYFYPFPTYITRCANEAEQGAKAMLQPPKLSVSRMEMWLFHLLLPA